MMAGPKEIPEKFERDRLAREAYLAGYSAAAEVAMSVPPPPTVPDDLITRIGRLEERVRLIENNDADRVTLVTRVDNMSRNHEHRIRGLEETAHVPTESCLRDERCKGCIYVPKGGCLPPADGSPCPVRIQVKGGDRSQCERCRRKETHKCCPPFDGSACPDIEKKDQGT